jgi:hypothetical protein
MSVKLSEAQFRHADQIAEDAWFDATKAALLQHHTHLAANEGERLFAACRVECRRLGIESEAALHAFFDMSFALGNLVSAQPSYQELHPQFLRLYGTPEHLPLYLYEKIE